MIDKYLIASEYGFNGIYRAKLITAVDESDIRAYIPGINNINPFDSNGNVDLKIYEKNKLSYPVVQWCCYNLESKELVNIKGPAWVMFENGDVQRPVCISYSVIGGEGETNAGSVTNTSVNYNTSSGQYELVVEKEVDALFTAYYSTPDGYSSAENRLQGGPIAANGETLDYTKLTCAAPKEVAFNTYVQVSNTNTSQDNVIYRVNDRGGAITINNDIYHFDLLMKDKSTAYSFGKVSGKAKLGTVLTFKNSSSGGSGSNIVENAKKYLGVPYVYGGTTPAGFDCSGLTQYVYNESGITIPRAAADQYKSNSGQFVDKSQLQPGDLIFFTGSNGSKSNPGHVGIYVGNNQMIHAPSSGKTVMYQDISTSYYNNSYVGAKRYN